MRTLTVLLALLLGASGLLAYGPQNIGGGDTLLSTGTSINPNTVATSSTYTKIGNTVNQSVLFVGAGTGGNPALTLDVECSYDGTNFYSPTVGASVTAIAVAKGVIAPICVPVSPYIRFKVYNTSSTVTATAVLSVLSQ